jgi:uncharacterized protein (TIGR03435 family)
MISATMIVASYGQTFEVASIKPAAEGATTPYIKDSSTWSETTNLEGMIVGAYWLPYYGFTAPEWTRSARFTVTAKIPEGTTKEQFQIMQQNLLIDRFKLKFHHEQKEVQGHQLVVAKGGTKLKESRHEDLPDAPVPKGPWKTDAEGFAIVPPEARRHMASGVNGLHMTQPFPDKTMEQLAGYLGNALGEPVQDTTGLKGTYDFDLKWIRENGMPTEGGPDIYQALQAQLGLKLEAKKIMIDVMIVDHVEKTPTEN